MTTEFANEYAVINEGKNADITVDGVTYRRICLRTHVLWQGDDLAEVAQKYAGPLLEKGDIIFFGEKSRFSHKRPRFVNAILVRLACHFPPSFSDKADYFLFL